MTSPKGCWRWSATGRGRWQPNVGVNTTLQQFQALEAAASPFVLNNWRFQQALYRRTTTRTSAADCSTRRRWRSRRTICCARQPERGPLLVLAEAEAVLDRAVTQPISSPWRTRLFQLAEALFQSPAHMQLSVKLYQGQEEVRGRDARRLRLPARTTAPG